MQHVRLCPFTMTKTRPALVLFGELLVRREPETFTTPPVDVTLSTRASVMAPFRKPRAQSSAVCLLLGAVAAVLGIIGLAAHHTQQEAASHHDVIHHFHSSSSRLDVGSDTPVKLGGGNRAGHVSQHPKADRFRSHVRARVDAHKNADGDNLDDLRSADETISSFPVKTIREDATSHSVSIADQCGESHANTEYWGDVVEEGTVGLIRTPEECCRRCAETTGCNVWVHCGDDESCHGSCWLKRTDDPNAPTVHASGANVPWTSGTVLKDFDPTPGKGASLGASEAFVALVTPAGRIRIRLKPEWHQPSSEHVARLADENACKGSCHLYRTEPGFLLQGTLRSFKVAANKDLKNGPKLMERGDIGWAGEGPGPDFFIYLGEKPADWLGYGHTVWGVIADEESLATVEKIVAMPSHTPGGPNTMRFLKEKMYFDIARD